MNPAQQEIIDRERKRANEALYDLRDEYPPADCIPARPIPWDSLGKPKAKELDDARRELAADVLQYEEFRRRGGDALSDYDLLVSSGGDGVAALDTALRLKSNHIGYSRSRLAYIEKHHGEQRLLFA